MHGQQNTKIQKKLGRWLINQPWAAWRGLADTQRQAQELISGPGLGTKARFMTFNRTQSRVATGLLTGYNTMRRRFYLLGLLGSQLCRRYGVREEISAHILCECEALASDMRIWAPFSRSPEDIKSLNLGDHLEL